MSEADRAAPVATSAPRPSPASANPAPNVARETGSVGNLVVAQLMRGGVGAGAAFPGAPLGNQDELRRVQSAGGGERLEPSLASRFSSGLGHDVSDVRVHPDHSAPPALGARAVTVGRDVLFAPGAWAPGSQVGRQLIGHELAHVAQQSAGRNGARVAAISDDALEREAEGAAARVLAGGLAGSLSPFGAQRPQLAPDPPPAGGATVGESVDNPAAPGAIDVSIAITTPGYEGKPPETSTVVLHSPVLGAVNVSTYAVPLGQLFASAEDAAQAAKLPPEEREKHSLLFAPVVAAKGVATPPSKSSTAPPPPTTGGKAADLSGAGSSGTAGQVTNAGPLTTDTPTTAYDIKGTAVQLVERAEGWGITTEYTKLATGAASCTVLKQPTGISLIDAGVKTAGKTIDERLKERTLKKLREMIGNEPIEDVFISHAHLDHVGILDAVGREFVIKRIHINEIQARDATFLERVNTLAADQAKLIKDKLRKKYEGKRDEWETEEIKTQIPEAGARDLAFQRWIEEQANLELAKTPPVELHMLRPGAMAGDTAGEIKIAEIPVVPVEPSKTPSAPGEGFVADTGAVKTILDPAYIEKLKKLQAGENVPLDEMSSGYLMTLPNGNQLAILPDIRVDDFKRVQATLIEELGALGAPVSFRIWDISHHLQAGFAPKDKPPAGTAAAPEPVGVGVGATRASSLVEMARMLSKLTGGKARPPGSVDVLIVSVDVDKIDPAMVALLKLMGLAPIPASGEQDVQVIAAIDAAGNKVQGVTSGDALLPSDPLLRRSSIALEDLRAKLEGLDWQVERAREKNKESAAELKKDLAPERANLVKERSSLQDKLRRRTAKIDPKSPDPSLATDIEDLQQKLKSVNDSIQSLDERVKQEAADDQDLIGQRDATRQLIKDIEAAERALIQKTEATAKAAKDAAPGSASPTEAEAKKLRDLVDPVYREAAGAGTLGKFGEKSLVILGRKTASTPEGQETLRAFTEAQQLRAHIDAAAKAGEPTLELHAELIGKLEHLKGQLATNREQLGEGERQAVDAELDFIDKQLVVSKQLIADAAAKGEHTVSREAGSGAKIDTAVFAQTTTEAAQQGSAPPSAAATAEGKPALPDQPVPVEGKAPDEALAAPPPAPTKLQKGVEKFGRAMGAVMVYQSITGGNDLLKRYGKDEASLGETSIGLTKSVVGATIGYRMLSGAHVGMGAFVVLSVLDVAQTALANYESTAEFDTEVTYAIIRNSVSLALAAIGTALIETANPIGIIAGLAIMFLGDPLLEALGVHEWLAKKFAFMPDENIETESELNDLIKDYAVILGAVELKAREASELAQLGVQDPSDLQKKADALAEARREALASEGVYSRERFILMKFREAYIRAQTGYAGLREIDELRARFLALWLQVHKGEPSYEDQGMQQPVTQKEIQETFADTEKLYATDTLTKEDVYGMEQWSKMDSVMEDLEDQLYHTDPEDVNWMKVSEYQRDVQLMISNAHYRLDPAAQGSNRATPMFSKDSPAGQSYRNILTVEENKFAVLQQRSIDVANNSVTTGLEEWHLFSKNEYKAEPEYKDEYSQPDVERTLQEAERAVLDYNWQEGNMGTLPGDLTAEDIYRSTSSLDKYRTETNDDGEYAASLFALRASQIAVQAILARMQAASATAQLTDDQLQRRGKVMKEFKRIEGERKTAGYLFWDELPALRDKIGEAHAQPLAAVLGEKPDLKQLSDAEKAALGSDELKDFQASSIADRLKLLGIEMPNDPDAPIPGMGRLVAAPSAIVAISDVFGAGYSYDDTETVTPLNAAAVAYFRGARALTVNQQDTEPVTLKQLLELNPEKKKVAP